MEIRLVLSILVFSIVMIILIIFKYKEMTELREEKEKLHKDEKPSLPPMGILGSDSNLANLLISFIKKSDKLLIPIGTTEDDKVKTIDLQKNPNLLLIGTTGGGKSICLNEILSSIAMNYTKDELRIVTIDTSIVELSSFNGIPHYVKETISKPQEITEELIELQNTCSS